MCFIFKVICTLEIYLTVKIVKFRPKYSNQRYAIIICILTGLVFLVYNFPKILFQGIKTETNGTSQIICLISAHNSKNLELWGSFVSEASFFLVNLEYINNYNRLNQG
jgi:hypothetical protein